MNPLPKQKVPMLRYPNKTPKRHMLCKPHIFMRDGYWHCWNKDASTGFKGCTKPVYAYRKWKRSVVWTTRRLCRS